MLCVLPLNLMNASQIKSQIKPNQNGFIYRFLFMRCMCSVVYTSVFHIRHHIILEINNLLWNKFFILFMNGNLLKKKTTRKGKFE